MIGVIVEHLKTHRHQLRKHSLFIGSAVKIPPEDHLVSDAIEQMAMEHAGDRLSGADEQDRPRMALEVLAEEVSDHAQRCRMLQEKLGQEVRPAEGHIRLSRLIKDGFYSTIFVCEPTDLLERALHSHHLEPDKDYHRLVAGIDDPGEIEIALEQSSRIALVHCCGDLRQDYLPLSPEEIEQAASSIQPALEEAFKIFSVFVAAAERDKPYIDRVPRSGDRVFWINRMVPMAEPDRYDELKMENPATAEFHALQPDVMELLQSRNSSRHLLCRDAGTFNEFFAQLHSRLVRRRRSGRGRPDLTVFRGGPYRFLDYFDVEDVDFYFGRDDDVETVMEQIHNGPIAVVFGEAAIGKTSLLRAGIMARLREETEDADKEETYPWLVAYTRVGDEPVGSIKSAIMDALVTAGYDVSDFSEQQAVAQIINEASRISERKVVLLLDQFAEFFAKLGDEVRREFVGVLNDILDECADSFRILISIREDYLGDLFELAEDLPGLMQNMHRLTDLSREEAKDAVLKPAQNFNLQIERTLVGRVVDDLYRDGVKPYELQIVMHALYEALSPRGRVITQRTYEKVGGAQEILDEYLERMLAQLPFIERRTASRSLVFMAGSSELKAAQTLERIVGHLEADRQHVEKVLARLVDLGLLRPLGRAPHRRYELMHEILADKIQEDLGAGQVLLRDVQDLITRELNSYEKFGLLMGADELKLIQDHKDELDLGPQELRLIVRSALTEGIDTEYWFERITELDDEKRRFIAILMQDPTPQVRLATYRNLRPHLEAGLIRHLVRGLDDGLPEVAALATEYLADMDRHLLAMLEHPDHRVRTLAARGLGAIADTASVSPLIEAFSDGDAELRDEITEALMEIGEPRAPRMLLRAVRGSSDGAWSQAYALGRLSVGEKEQQELENAVERTDRPELLYALAICHTYRRNYEQAEQILQDLPDEVNSGYPLEAVKEAQQYLRSQRARAALAEDMWAMFGRTAQHESYTKQEVKPELQMTWRFDTEDNVVASPVVRDNTAYIGSRDEWFYAIDTGKGTVQWKFRADGRIEGAAALTDTVACFPTLAGTIYGLARETGQESWQTQLGSPVRANCSIENHSLYIGTRAGAVVRIDMKTGDVAWQRKLPNEISSTAAVAGGIAVLGCWDGNIYALDTETGDIVWEYVTDGPVSSSPAIADDTVYCGSDDENLHAIELHNGTQLWKRSVSGELRSSPAVCEQLVIVGSIDGNCYALHREDGSTAWTAPTEEDIIASPTIAADTVYVGSKDGCLYAFDRDSGQQLWRHKTSYGIYSSPAVAEQTVFIGLDYYGIAAFRPVA